MSNAYESHTYRIEVKVPRIAREGTTWRTLVEPTSYSEMNDHAMDLRSSLYLAGFDHDKVDQWFADHVRCVEYKTETTRTRELPMTGRS